MPEHSLIEHLNRRRSALDLERSSFIAHARDLSEFIRPRRGRFLTTDVNKGNKRHKEIINSVGTYALRVATSGMLNGTMSPTRPWFNLETQNPDLMETAGVKDWLWRVELILRAIFNQSNLYSMAPTMLGELILFGTGCMTHVDDFDDVARFYTHTFGSYMISQNDRYEVDTLFREFQMTVAQMVKQFGKANVSKLAQDMYDKGDYDVWFPVNHVIQPNELFNPNSSFSAEGAFSSVYYEPGNKGEEGNKLLSRKGFESFPAYVPRWELTGEDIYGTDCPGMTSLGDVKGLQIEERRKAQGIDKMVNPPLSGPPSIRNTPVSSLPGNITVYDAGTDGHQLKPIYQVAPQLGDLRADISAVEQRILKAFFVNLFLAISEMEGIQPRNELDLMSRNEERLLQLGPVLERLHGEFLTKLIDRTYRQALAAGILPEPPEALSQSQLQVKYISTLAMAQRAVATQSIDRLFAFAGGLADAGWDGALRKLDAQQAVDEYGKAIGVPPSVVVPDEVVAEQEAEIQQKQELAEQLEGAQQMANTAKLAGDAKTGGGNLLSDVAEGL